MFQQLNVLIIGVGALGCHVLALLSECNIFKEILIVDPDVVETRNLGRQQLYTCSDIACPKVEAARNYINNTYAGVVVRSYYDKVEKLPVEVLRSCTVWVCTADILEVRRWCNLAVKSLFLQDNSSEGFMGHIRYINKLSSCIECDPSLYSQNLMNYCDLVKRPTHFIHCLNYAKSLAEQYEICVPVDFDFDGALRDRSYTLNSVNLSLACLLVYNIITGNLCNENNLCNLFSFAEYVVHYNYIAPNARCPLCSDVFVNAN